MPAVSLAAQTIATSTVAAKLYLPLPFQPSAVIPVQLTQNAVVDYADDRTRYGRRKGSRYFEFDLSFNNRQLAEFARFRTFWQDLYPASPFTWVEPFQNLTLTCYFTSNLSYDIESSGAINYRVRVEGTQ